MAARQYPWHPADILCAVNKMGLSYASIARDAGLCDATVKQAARRPSWAGEQAIAKALNVPAHRIWPDRYDAHGEPLHKKTRNRLNAAKAAKERKSAGSAG